MMVINGVRDVRTYVDNAHADFGTGGLSRSLVTVIMEAEHPAYGEDWSEWLTANIDRLRDEAATIYNWVPSHTETR